MKIIDIPEKEPDKWYVYVIFNDEESASNREKYFKSGSGREWLKNRLAGDK